MPYSQNSEEAIIKNYFKSYKGTFLDIGCNDGITLSNTFALALEGWKGTLVDASPMAYERLLNNYAGKENYDLLNYAIGSQDGEILLHESGELLGKGDVALVSSTRTDETERWATMKMPFTDVLVPCLTFKSLLEKTSFKKYELVSIDIEGMEKEVVPQINFFELGTRMAVIEWNSKDGKFYDGLMIPHGFRLIHMNAENRIYAK